MFHSLHGLRGKILVLCLGSLTLLGLAMGAAGVYAVVQAAEAAQPDVRATVFQLITIFVWCLLLSAFVSLILTTRLAQSIDELMDAAKQIGVGDLDVTIDIDSDDEVGQLARLVEKMARSLKETLTRMHRMTYHDGLTDIYNRLGIDRVLSSWRKDAGDRPAVVISLDIDDFKFINDLLGHAAGDAALKALAHRLQEFFGGTAKVGRQGGDEFMVLLPDTTAEQAHQLLSRLTERQQCYFFNGTEHAFTISLGYVSYPDQAQSVRELARAADAALYATKLKGKNGFSRYAAEQEQVDRAKLSFSMRDISQNLPGAILVYKATDGRILYANDELIHLCGCEDIDDFMAYARGEFPFLLYPADRTSVPARVRAQTATSREHTSVVHYRIRTKDDTLRCVLDITRLKSSPYHGAVYYAVLVDETDLR